MPWFEIIVSLVIGSLALAILIWSFVSLKEIFTLHPRKYSDSTYYWITTVIIGCSIVFILHFLLDLLRWSGQLFKATIELLIKSLIF